MSRINDVGGMTGFAAIVEEPDEPPFHHDWEAHVFALIGPDDHGVDEHHTGAACGFHPCEGSAERPPCIVVTGTNQRPPYHRRAVIHRRITMRKTAIVGKGLAAVALSTMGILAIGVGTAHAVPIQQLANECTQGAGGHWSANVAGGYLIGYSCTYRDINGDTYTDVYASNGGYSHTVDYFRPVADDPTGPQGLGGFGPTGPGGP